LPLPPAPPIELDDDLLSQLSKADRALGRLDGATEILPDPDIFVFMYVRKEAVLSSMIEGTQASLMDLLEFEAQALRQGTVDDVEEVSNYVAAMNHGLEQIQRGRRLSICLLQEIHSRLMRGVRGGELRPGTLRKIQNWIGPAGLGIGDAVFVPPAPADMNPALDELEVFLASTSNLPALVKAGLAHVQFESIHPFMDGNGRMGRLLITFLLTIQGALGRPLLYLSHYLYQHRSDYYSRLQAVRDEGDWEGWLKFFLTGVHEVSVEATSRARKILTMRENHRRLVQEKLGTTTSRGLTLVEGLYRQPIISIQEVARLTGLTQPSATRLVNKLVGLELLEELTGRARYRRFGYQPYLELMAD